MLLNDDARTARVDVKFARAIDILTFHNQGLAAPRLLQTISKN